MSRANTRAAQHFFGVGKFIPEKMRVARCCTFLLQRVCHNCDKNVKKWGLKVLDTENEQCRECVRHTYLTAYKTECKSV